MSEEPAIGMRGVTVRQGGISILTGVTASVPRGSVTAIIGPNGAGKTTLLRAMLGLCSYSGSITYFDRDGRPASYPRRIGYVPQRLDFDRGMPMTVLDLLLLDQQRRPLWLGRSAPAVARAKAQLQRVEAVHLIDRPIGKLSGGEFQRVQLALSLMADPEIILLDEPVSGVDVQGGQLFCDLLETIQRESLLTVVMVSHDLSVVSKHATHVLCLNRELLAAGTVHEALTPSTLSQVFGPHALFGHVHGLCSHTPPGA
ncbi:metal ABC transporter ATP-binding protein [bacterium]|jgi:zinc transport system ATP-binding protein|nr:metal ABC transporter ATP-binding protein [bacterium]